MTKDDESETKNNDRSNNENNKSNVTSIITMIVSKVLKTVLHAFGYPAFPTSPSDLVGEFRVGAIRARIPGAVSCQIHYPTLDCNASSSSSSSSFTPYMRPATVQGIADYSRQSPHLLSFLSQRAHPCIMNASPMVGDDNKKFPIVIFSHGLGGCMEMYTALCQQMASMGYYVVALEHEDGSGAYAESFSSSSDTKGPIYYKRPDDTPYSRHKVVNFRKPFLTQRVQEIDSVLDYLKQQSTDMATNRDDHKEQAALQHILSAADHQQGVHLVGHSFGGATVVLAQQDEAFTQRHQVQSLTLLDCWAFSLPDTSLAKGCRSKHVLSFLSEAWITNPETEQVKELLRNSQGGVASYYVPNSVHASFSDAAHWFPGWIARRLYMRATGESRHATIRTVARAWVRYARQPTTGDNPAATTTTTTTATAHNGLREFPVEARQSRTTTMVSSSS